jgi:hypothetical protein
MEEIKTSDIIKGLIIGGILLWIFTRKNDMSMQNMQQNSQQTQIGINNWKSLDYVQDFDEFNSRLTQPATVHNVENIEQKVEQIDDNSTQYKNKEVWKIGRNTDGDIETIEVERNAKVT